MSSPLSLFFFFGHFSSFCPVFPVFSASALSPSAEVGGLFSGFLLQSSFLVDKISSVSSELQSCWCAFVSLTNLGFTLSYEAINSLKFHSA